MIHLPLNARLFISIIQKTAAPRRATAQLAEDASAVNTEKASRSVWLVKVPRYLSRFGCKPRAPWLASWSPSVARPPPISTAATVDARQSRENSNSTQLHKIVHSLVGLVRSPVFTTLVQAQNHFKRAFLL
ncbi:hypothetical protein GPALN_014384 [Globodera pallida]|nr:hypothetical protein GPALN_014384 [Globodera pallida]